MLSKTATFTLIALGTVVGLAGTDLVLPAVPGLPQVLSGELRQAQYVLAAFAAGTGVGLIVYGELGARFIPGNLLVLSLFLYAALSLVATFADSLWELSLLRFFQGLVAAAPAVFAPVMIKAMFDESAAIAALGRIGSIESMTPAFAPLLGVWLLGIGSWQTSFYLTAVLALTLGVIWLVATETRMQFVSSHRASAGYLSLLFDLAFLRHAISQAFTLGALLIIVFAAPAVITQALGGELHDFIIMQVLGITFFVLAANTSHFLVERIGNLQTVLLGTIVTAIGCASMLILSLLANDGFERMPLLGVWMSFIFVNLGLGIRGPSGFFNALAAAGDNESRGSALIILLVMFTTAMGTALVAPYVGNGFRQVAGLATLVAIIAVVLSWPGATHRLKAT